MIRKALFAGVLASLLAAFPAQAQDAKPQYTVAEYNAYQACLNDANAASKLKCFEGFQTTYPQSTLMPFVYAQCLQAASASNNAAKVIEYADKVNGMGDKADVPTRFQAYYLRADSYHRLKRPPDPAGEATRARAAATEALALVPKLTKPENVAQDQFDTYVNGAKTLWNYTIGVTSASLKDYAKAIEGFQNALVTNPADGLIRYQLAVNYMSMTPPQYMDGFWSLARAINLKVAGEAQVRSYLRNQIMRYQGGRVLCDKETDAQLNELLALAAAGPDRPADYSIPTSEAIEAVQKQINILTLIKGLKEGGKTARLTWLASCGLEFPEVQGKVMSNTEGPNGAIIGVFIGETEQEFTDATAANLEVKVVEQPDAARVKKDELVKFSGHIAAFTPEPFMITFEKAKVDPTTIPEPEVAAPAKKAPAKKAPAKKAPSKRPPGK